MGGSPGATGSGTPIQTPSPLAARNLNIGPTSAGRNGGSAGPASALPEGSGGGGGSLVSGTSQYALGGSSFRQNWFQRSSTPYTKSSRRLTRSVPRTLRSPSAMAGPSQGTLWTAIHSPSVASG